MFYFHFIFPASNWNERVEWSEQLAITSLSIAKKWCQFNWSFQYCTVQKQQKEEEVEEEVEDGEEE